MYQVGKRIQICISVQVPSFTEIIHDFDHFFDHNRGIVHASLSNLTLY